MSGHLDPVVGLDAQIAERIAEFKAGLELPDHDNVCECGRSAHEHYRESIVALEALQSVDAGDVAPFFADAERHEMSESEYASYAVRNVLGMSLQTLFVSSIVLGIVMRLQVQSN